MKRAYIPAGCDQQGRRETGKFIDWREQAISRLQRVLELALVLCGIGGCLAAVFGQ